MMFLHATIYRHRLRPDDPSGTIINASYSSWAKVQTRPAPKIMPGIKPASAHGPGAPAGEAMVAGMKAEEGEEAQATMTAMILPEQLEDEDGTRTTTVVIEETPDGTIIQQQVAPVEAHAKQVQVIDQQQQQRVIQIQAAEGQDLTGIPVRILQDATTADGQKISIIRIAEPEEGDADGATAIMQGGAVVQDQDGQQVYVSGGVAFTRQQVDSGSVEIVMSGENNM